ncbi:MAG: WG repeat-containing protein [Candidatus Obscuribacterales bacterium]|nr:WG repeat-containing protein [Candidatus Obscuribacterales bacterium]
MDETGKVGRLSFYRFLITAIIVLTGLICACTESKQDRPKKEVKEDILADWGKWGYIDKTGKFIIPARFDNAESFQEGLARVEQKGKFEFIDRTGKSIFTVNRECDHFFSDGLLSFKKDSQWGFMDKTGRVVIEPNYSAVRQFAEGLACVKQHDRWGFIDKTGKMVIEPNYLKSTMFSNGYAHVKLPRRDSCFIDRKGQLLVSDYSAGEPFTEDLAGVKKGKFGFIDANGKLIIPHQFDDAKPFSEGRAPVKVGHDWGFIDKRGKVRVKPAYYRVLGFCQGLAGVFDQKGYFGFVDKEGVPVIKTSFHDGSNFSEGLAPVMRDDIWGYIDKTGEFTIKPRFVFAGIFKEGLAPVSAR